MNCLVVLWRGSEISNRHSGNPITSPLHQVPITTATVPRRDGITYVEYSNVTIISDNDVVTRYHELNNVIIITIKLLYNYKQKLKTNSKMQSAAGRSATMDGLYSIVHSPYYMGPPRRR